MGSDYPQGKCSCCVCSFRYLFWKAITGAGGAVGTTGGSSTTIRATSVIRGDWSHAAFADQSTSFVAICAALIITIVHHQFTLAIVLLTIRMMGSVMCRSCLDGWCDTGACVFSWQSPSSVARACHQMHATVMLIHQHSNI